MLPQNPVIQPEKIDYGEVALKVRKPRKSDRLQRKSEQPLNPARSFYKQIRKKLSCPATQIRIFLSVVLIFGTVLTIGYVMSSETLEHGANRNLKGDGFRAKAGRVFRNMFGLKKHGSKRTSVAENAESAQNGGNGGNGENDGNVQNGENGENAGNTARLKTITSYDKSEASVTYKCDEDQEEEEKKKKTISITGKDKFTTKFTIGNNTWLSPGDPRKRGDAGYDALVDVLNTNNNRETVYLKAMKKGKDAKSGKTLLNTIKQGLSKPSTKKVTLPNLDHTGLKFLQKTIEERHDSYEDLDDRWYVKEVYNTVLEGKFSNSKGKFTNRAYGKSPPEIKPGMVFKVPVSPTQLNKQWFDIVVEFSGPSTRVCSFRCSKTRNGWTAALFGHGCSDPRS